MISEKQLYDTIEFYFELWRQDYKIIVEELTEDALDDDGEYVARVYLQDALGGKIVDSRIVVQALDSLNAKFVIAHFYSWLTRPQKVTD